MLNSTLATLHQFYTKGKVKVDRVSSSQQASPLRELSCHTGSHSVTCHPAEVTFSPVGLSQPKLVIISAVDTVIMPSVL